MYVLKQMHCTKCILSIIIQYYRAHNAHRCTRKKDVRKLPNNWSVSYKGVEAAVIIQYIISISSPDGKKINKKLRLV